MKNRFHIKSSLKILKVIFESHKKINNKTRTIICAFFFNHIVKISQNAPSNKCLHQIWARVSNVMSIDSKPQAQFFLNKTLPAQRNPFKYSIKKLISVTKTELSPHEKDESKLSKIVAIWPSREPFLNLLLMTSFEKLPLFQKSY